MNLTTPLRILHIIPSLAKGGAERLVVDICSQLQLMPNVEVLLVRLHEKNDFAYSTKEINTTVCAAWNIPSMSSKPNVNIAPFTQIISDFKPHIIHSHLFEAEMVSHAELIPGVCYVSHLHNNMQQFQGVHLPISKRMLTDAYEKKLLLKQYKRCDNQFIAVSNHTYQYFQKHLPKQFAKHIFLLPNAIQYNQFHKAVQNKTKNSSINLVTVGSLLANKNHAFLIDVVAFLMNKGFDTTLQIIGDGPEKEALMQSIQSKGLADNVQLIGQTNDVAQYLHQNNIYVHASFLESFGLVLLEAMAAGLPCVTLDGKGNRDIMQEGKNGFMVKQEDVNEFADKIIRLYENPVLYKEMSINAKDFASQYDIKPYCEKLIDFYQTIITKK
jgi:glycosyltransferase involved in cell wall biosynthesis